jgi:hypothetical protein
MIGQKALASMVNQERAMFLYLLLFRCLHLPWGLANLKEGCGGNFLF